MLAHDAVPRKLGALGREFHGQQFQRLFSNQRILVPQADQGPAHCTSHQYF